MRAKKISNSAASLAAARPVTRLITLFVVTVLTGLFAERAEAQYPSAKQNAFVREEVKGDPDRLIPVTDHFAFAVDGEVYFRNDGAEEFYHGIGYWTQIRSEAMPSEFFRVNVRSILYAGSCSGGYVQPSGDYHLLAISATLPQPFLNGKLFFRGPDLDRQTLGVGLVIEEKEFNGALVQWSQGPHTFKLRADGTGLFRLNDDAYNWEASIYDGLLGLGGLYWTQGIDQDHLDHNRDPYHYAYSTQTFDWFTYGAEFGTRAGPTAGLLSLGAKHAFGDFRLEAKVQGRRYNSGFARDFAGQIEQQYVAYDQYDKQFTNAANIFVNDDNVNVGAGLLNLWYRISRTWRFHSLNETGKFDYRNKPAISYYVFRQGVEICPFAERDDCLNLFVSNKIMMNTYSRPSREISLSDDPVFKTLPFFGMEARFRL